VRRFATVALVACGFFAATPPARAFYWFDWPGSGIPRVPTLIDTPRPGDPPPPAGRVEPGPTGPELPINNPGGPGPGPGPNHVPEPATALLALAGVGALALNRRARRR
jgi:hypothetical protein